MGKTFKHDRNDFNDSDRNQKKKSDKFAQRRQKRLRTITDKQKTILPSINSDQGGVDRL